MKPNGNVSLYDLMAELDRLEEIREDMIERDLRSIEEIDARIAELSRKVDDLPDEDGQDSQD